MALTCKIKPDKDTCLACMTGRIQYELPGECDTCEKRNKKYTILQLGTNKNEGDYAFVLADGVISRVKLDRIEQVEGENL